MKKRSLSLILALLMVFSLLPVSAAADAPKSGTCGENLTWTLDDKGVLTISGTGDMEDMTYGSPWESSKDEIKAAVVGEGVTSIESGAFTECGYLETISIPSTVTKIDPWSFAGCVSLTGIELPEGIKSIGENTFSVCRALTSITIPMGVETIGANAFRDCTGLASVSIPDSVTSIGRGAFLSCTALESIVIPDSVRNLGSSAFSSCTALKSVTLPKSLSSIGDNTFDSCTSLEQITLPKTVKEIGMDAFMGCSSLKSLNIPNGVERLKGRIVCLCTSLERISLPASLKVIESEAFLDCSGLKDVYFGGTRAQWNAISIGSDNDILTSASIHFTGEYPFTDVKVNGTHKPYADAIKWASDNGVTTGYGDGIFKPDQSCTRAQVVTFLWRAAGKPVPKSTNNPFADVSAKQANGSDNPYYTAILWAVGEGITLGYDSTHFAPDKSVTRAQFVTFLWRYENKPEAKDGMSIKDIDAVTVADFRAAILWAAGEGITTGYADGSFRPDNTCTRAHVVTFIYRDIA